MRVHNSPNTGLWLWQDEDGAAKQERDEATIQEVQELKRAGFKIAAIAQHTGLSVTAVRLMLKG